MLFTPFCVGLPGLGKVKGIVAQVQDKHPYAWWLGLYLGILRHISWEGLGIEVMCKITHTSWEDLRTEVICKHETLKGRPEINFCFIYAWYI